MCVASVMAEAKLISNKGQGGKSKGAKAKGKGGKAKEEKQKGNFAVLTVTKVIIGNYIMTDIIRVAN